MYVNDQSPFVLLVLGLLISVTCGLAFEATLKQGVQNWSKDRSGRILEQLQGVRLTLPYFGISAGIWLFLGAGLTVFGLPDWLSIGSSLVLTLLTSGLIWAQLGQVLVQLQRGGSRSLDLDVPE